MANILQQSLKSKYSTKSSFEFCEEVNQTTLPADYIMISLDVVSLFTNVPRELVFKCIIDRWSEINTNINLDLFLEIIDFCMTANYFRYKDKIYIQTYGTAMGSPLSPILAEIVLDELIDKAMNSLKIEMTIFRKYVDDLFLTIPRNKTDQVLNEFNAHDPRLQFTLEVEKDNKLPFLDLTVIRREDQTLVTEWYSKAISSGRMLNYNSFHSPRYKMNVATNFIHRVCEFSRNQSAEEIQKTVQHHLGNNNYPKTLVNRLLQNNKRYKMLINKTPTPSATSSSIQEIVPENQQQQHHHSTTHRPSNQETSAPETSDIPAITPADHTTSDNPDQQQPTYMSIPYVPVLSERITKTLATDYPSITIATRQTRTVKSFYTHVKDPVSEEDKNNIIYKIPCSNCEVCYIGMTKNKLRTRIAGHQSQINKLDQLVEQGYTNTCGEIMGLREKTALTAHCVDTEHRFSFHNTAIIDHSNKPHILPFLEMCNIVNTKHTINRRTDTEGLNSMYAGILHTIKTKFER